MANGRERSRHGLARAMRPGHNCIGNVVFTCACEGWGFHLITLAKLLSPSSESSPPSYSKADVSLSSTSPPRRSTRGSATLSSRRTPSTPRCGRIVLDAYALLPAACHYQAS
uniref:Uncharacterized protein n=1 Tax=Oryza punctata TaxID=4537 RepID=A0A0E0JJC3_ORYPU